MPNELSIVLVAGGSGGHIFPALSLIRSLHQRHPGARVCLVTTRHPRDQRALASMPDVARDARIRLHAMPRLSTRWWHRMLTLPGLWSTARQLLAQTHPSVVIGFGGWLTVPWLLAAHRQGYPVLIHEQNVIPGRANRLVARVASHIAVSFDETRRMWPRMAGKMTVTGNPIRLTADALTRDMARRHWNVNGEPLILAIGGSGGSHAINETLPRACAALPASLRSRVHILHLAGANECRAVEQHYQALEIRARVVPFLDHMALAYRAADVAVCRAGASTIAELAHFGCPAVLIPYPHARQHQHANAAVVASLGGGVVLEQTTQLAAHLKDALQQLLPSSPALQEMRSRIRQLDVSEASDRLAKLVLAPCGERVVTT